MFNKFLNKIVSYYNMILFFLKMKFSKKFRNSYYCSFSDSLQSVVDFFEDFDINDFQKQYREEFKK